MHLQRTQTHNVWDRTIAPVLHVAPGDTVVVASSVASFNGRALSHSRRT